MVSYTITYPILPLFGKNVPYVPRMYPIPLEVKPCTNYSPPCYHVTTLCLKQLPHLVLVIASAGQTNLIRLTGLYLEYKK